VGEETTTLIGTFVSQAPLTEYREVPSSVKPVQVQYETVDRKPVYELTLKPTHRPAGTAADNIAIVHTFTELAAAPLEAGQWLACVFQDGQLEKICAPGTSGRSSIRASSSPRTKTPHWVRGSAATHRPVRGASDWPWSSSSAKPRSSSSVRRPSRGMVRSPTGDGCPICKSDQGEVEDFTLRCPNCTGGLRYSAELLLAERVEVDPGTEFEFLSWLESRWLLSQIPKEVEVSA
jgi:hypothetical protein